MANIPFETPRELYLEAENARLREELEQAVERVARALYEDEVGPYWQNRSISADRDFTDRARRILHPSEEEADLKPSRCSCGRFVEVKDERTT